uniref:Large ribosomal subunit protein bL33c n=1 Tax=Astrosyne radiata TaxID=1158023 RepID=A0A2U9NTB4_9STRA|nr:ribosomal protein L33 [Astrosyne radiata]AWT40309.1 ribosomal protein L33 [Astrosyne radiata]
MAKNKLIRITITLECLECRTNKSDPSKKSLGVSRYHTTKNRLNNPKRLEVKKYCPNCNRPTIHKEIR